MVKDSHKKQKLAQALRENLLRRKQALRERLPQERDDYEKNKIDSHAHEESASQSS